jgi:antitoxin component YwqK of YwqJK toxin-antitoxin module
MAKIGKRGIAMAEKILESLCVLAFLGCCNGHTENEVNVEKYGNGNIQAEYEFYRKNGDEVYNGYYREYFPNGLIQREMTYKDHQKTGWYHSYHENGKIREEVTFKNGEIHGWFVLYDIRGVIERESSWKNGEEYGLSVEYYPNGGKKVERVSGLQDGKNVVTYFYDRNGNPLF